MRHPLSHLPEVIQEAKRPGLLAPPSRLLAALAATDDPLAAFSGHDALNDLFAELYGEFEVLRPGTWRTGALQPDQQARWASLVRWLINEVGAWRRSEDPRNYKLAAIFVVAQANDWENALWQALPEEVATNLDLVERLKEVVRSFRLTFSAPAGQSAPIWEHEAVQQYEAADARGDWAVVGNSLRIFERQMFSHLPLTQSVRCLNRCGLSHLVDASVAMRQTIAAIQVAAALHVHERLRLAGASENPYIQFGCAYETLSGRQAADRFSADEQLLMEQLLVNVAAVPDRWAGWMRAFNAIPARFRALQVPLGRAMARTPEAAGAAYVDAITLFCSPAAATRPDQHAGRRAIAECLSAFRAEASLERRIVLWTAAHHRWSAWNFDERNSNTHLFAVCWSDLDYASIGFACECMAEGDRLAAMNAIREKLRSIDLRWHESISDIISAWNRLLSQFQPYARASQLAATAGDWSSEKQVVLPFDPATSRYLMLKYRIPEMTPPVAPADQNVCGMDPKSETQLIGR